MFQLFNTLMTRGKYDFTGDKPMTFNGQSYARWRLVDSIERRLSLYLEIRTVQRSARLMHSAGRVDYSILEVSHAAPNIFIYIDMFHMLSKTISLYIVIVLVQFLIQILFFIEQIEDNLVQYRFDCGSGAGIVRVSGHFVNDGRWHSIKVERRGQHAEVLLDGKYSAESSAPGTNDVLNLESHDVYFGAQVENHALGYTDIRKGFEGCMKQIKVGGVVLPYIQSNSVATLQKFESIEFDCRGSYVPGNHSPLAFLSSTSGIYLYYLFISLFIECCLFFPPASAIVNECCILYLWLGVCSSRPCVNGGTCVAVGSNYRCQCRQRFVGQRCEVDTDPCASNPCLYGGQSQLILVTSLK